MRLLKNIVMKASLASILKKATIVTAGLGAFLAADRAYAQTTWNTRGLTHEQIKDIMDGNGRNDASPGDTIKFNVTSYTMPSEYDPFIVGIDNLTITGNGDTMDSTVIQNYPDIGIVNGLVFDVRAINNLIKNMTIENIQSGIKAGELPQEKRMDLLIKNVLIRNTDFAISYDSVQDGDGDRNREGKQNLTLISSVIRDSNVGIHPNSIDERTGKVRYCVPISNTFINCNLAMESTWFCVDGNYPCDYSRIYVPGIGRTDGNTINGYNIGQSFTDIFFYGSNGKPGDETADNTIEYLVTNLTLAELGLGKDNLETDPIETFWGYVEHRGSPRIGTDGKTIVRGGRKNYFADYDKDNDVDLKDIQVFQNYFSGNSTYTIDDRAKITSIDWNGEDNVNGEIGIRVNLTDYANIVPAITGPEK